VCKAALPASIATLLTLRYFPLRYMVAAGLWVPALSQVEFFKVLGTAITLQLSEIDYEEVVFALRSDVDKLLSRF
jgi:hypothetical protein